MNNSLARKFLSNATWIMVGRIFQLLLTLLTTTFIARYLGPTEYGKIGFMYSYVALFIPICALGMNDIIVKELTDNKEKSGEIVGTILSLRILTSLCCVAIIYFVFKNIVLDKKTMMVLILQSFALVFQSFECLMYFFQANYLSKNTGVTLLISYILTALFRLFGIMLKKDLLWFAFAVSLDYIVIAIIFMILYKKEKGTFSFNIETAKKLLSKSYNYIFAGIMIVIYGKADSILLGNMVDETTVGYYSAATMICNAWPFILTAIIDSANPMIVELFNTNKSEYKKRIKQLYAAVFYIGVLAAIGITALSKPIIMIMYGSAYMPSIIPLRIVCWSTIFAYLGVARATWMQCENKLGHEKELSLMGAIFDVVLNVILIKRYGIAGAAIALFLTQFFTNFVFVYLIKDTRENAKLIIDAVLLKGIKTK